MPSANVADEAVRNFLQYVIDPTQLIDAQKVAEIERRVEQATDLLDRLVALAELERAKLPDELAYRDAFIAHARSWATDHEVTVGAFQKMGVPEDALTQAGFEIGPPSSKLRSPASKRRSAGRRASSGVSVEEIKARVSRLDGDFTMADVEREAGGSPMTVRKALTQLADEGLIRRLGPARNWTARGRAPIVYRRT